MTSTTDMQYWNVEDRVSGAIEPYFGTLAQVLAYVKTEAVKTVAGLAVYRHSNNDLVVIITKEGTYTLEASYCAS